MVLGVGSTYIGGLFVVILTHLLWFIGIHGGNSLGPILESKLSQFLFDNITSAGHNILTKSQMFHSKYYLQKFSTLV